MQSPGYAHRVKISNLQEMANTIIYVQEHGYNTQIELKNAFSESQKQLDQYRKCADVLAHKKKEYTGDRIDRLSAFKIAASLQGCTPKTALAGMMSKHVVSLYDMCYSSLLQFELEQWDEKITDCINYLILLKALIKEEQAYGSH